MLSCYCNEMPAEMPARRIGGILIPVVKILVHSIEEMNTLGAQLARQLRGGDVVELVGDIGAGKTTLTKAIAASLGVDEEVQSPTFTISRMYPTQWGTLAHYDFYRLNDPGIMATELAEHTSDPQAITIVEWAGVVDGVLPPARIVVRITPRDEAVREVVIEGVTL